MNTYPITCEDKVQELKTIGEILKTQSSPTGNTLKTKHNLSTHRGHKNQN
jgi:hypothetical protein